MSKRMIFVAAFSDDPTGATAAKSNIKAIYKVVEDRQKQIDAEAQPNRTYKQLNNALRHDGQSIYRIALTDNTIATIKAMPLETA